MERRTILEYIKKQIRRIRLIRRAPIWCALLAQILVIISCDFSKSESIEGTYVARTGGFTEKITLERNGKFTHTVEKSGVVLVNEDGNFKVKGSVVILSEFTEYYSPIKESIMPNGKEFGSYQLTYINLEGVRSVLKPAETQQYELVKLRRKPAAEGKDRGGKNGAR